MEVKKWGVNCSEMKDLGERCVLSLIYSYVAVEVLCSKLSHYCLLLFVIF
jgi:hypothetical protein